MSDPQPSADTAVAVALAELRGTLQTGFARVDGSLALLVQRGDQTEQKITDHTKRLDALERNRWPLPSLAALIGVGSLALSAWQFAAH